MAPKPGQKANMAQQAKKGQKRSYEEANAGTQQKLTTFGVRDQPAKPAITTHPFNAPPVVPNRPALKKPAPAPPEAERPPTNLVGNLVGNVRNGVNTAMQSALGNFCSQRPAVDSAAAASP